MRMNVVAKGFRLVDWWFGAVSKVVLSSRERISLGFLLLVVICKVTAVCINTITMAALTFGLKERAVMASEWAARVKRGR